MDTLFHAEQLQQTLSEHTSSLPPSTPDLSSFHQQLEYIDKKLQSTLQRVLDVKEESDRIVVTENNCFAGIAKPSASKRP
jgi:hypothetical protein